MAAPPPPGGDMMAPPPPGGDMMAPPVDNTAPPAVEEPKSGSNDRYIVVGGDSLWKISGKKKIHGDSFQWPLLFIANRERIKDPDIIRPKWELNVKRGLAADEVSSAVQKAKDTPRYTPHTAPRKRLPIEY